MKRILLIMLLIFTGCKEESVKPDLNVNLSEEAFFPDTYLPETGRVVKAFRVRKYKVTYDEFKKYAPISVNAHKGMNAASLIRYRDVITFLDAVRKDTKREWRLGKMDEYILLDKMHSKFGSFQDFYNIGQKPPYPIWNVRHVGDDESWDRSRDGSVVNYWSNGQELLYLDYKGLPRLLIRGYSPNRYPLSEYSKFGYYSDMVMNGDGDGNFSIRLFETVKQ